MPALFKQNNQFVIQCILNRVIFVFFIKMMISYCNVSSVGRKFIGNGLILRLY